MPVGQLMTPQMPTKILVIPPKPDNQPTLLDTINSLSPNKKHDHHLTQQEQKLQ
jgi:hypothetical protein